MEEARFHGRGGQGAVTAAEILAVAAGLQDKHSQAFPFFGVERRGAPVMSFCRIDSKPVRIHQQVYEPGYIIILDASLINANITKGLKQGGKAIVNTKKTKEELASQLGLAPANVFVVDATGIALKNLGRPIVNTAMLGAFSKVTGIVELDSVKKAVQQRFPAKLAETNVKAVEDCFNQVK
ncbi:MAG: pyruvate ferredoxin oxidoreductase subunit gamma [Candidatus Micrarchaeota archaeon]|nr:pyruvate ferredoxin oxidoreductase subunit gamma [Candidatus Micrarchaeota archaeon]